MICCDGEYFCQVFNGEDHYRTHDELFRVTVSKVKLTQDKSDLGRAVLSFASVEQDDM